TQETLDTQAITPEEVFLNALVEDKVVFASDALASGLRMSDQEGYVLEQVEATIRTALNPSRLAYQEAKKLYQEIKSKLKPSDFSSRAEYDFIFRATKNAEGMSDYLSRF